jgi:hypothetical protein
MTVVHKVSVAAGLIAIAISVGDAKAQQPTPPIVIVQAAGAPSATPAPAAAAAPNTTLTDAIKALEQIKDVNDATLKKQEAMLQQLDELQKAAEQLKVFAKRV